MAITSFSGRTAAAARPLGIAASVCLTLALAFTALAFTAPAFGATRTVCALTCDFTSIQGAVTASAAGDTISVMESPHVESGITIGTTLTLQGMNLDAAATVIDGNAAGRLIAIQAGANLTLRNLTLANGAVAGENAGGAILNAGTALIENVRMIGNYAGFGGGAMFIQSIATATLRQVTVQGNTSGSYAGAIFSYGTLTIEASAFTGNSTGGIVPDYPPGAPATSGNGGALMLYGPTTISNSTFSGNAATNGGTAGAIIAVGGAGGSLAVSNSTISGNTADTAAGIYVAFMNAGVKNTIIADNLVGANCVIQAGVIDGGSTSLATDASCGFTQVTPAQLQLGTLAANLPGLTPTIALLPGSVAIDAASDCNDYAGNALATDQRSVVRPQGGACDVGAYELRQRVVTVAVSGSGSANGTAGSPVGGGINACTNGSGTCTAAYSGEPTALAVALLIVPTTGFHVGTVSGCGGSLGGTTFTLAALITDCTVNVAFVANPPPSADAQSAAVAYNTAHAMLLTGSDANPNGSLAFAIASGPAHGSLSTFDPATGAVTYIPVTGYAGADSFTFTVHDGNGTSAPATVTLTVATGVLPVAAPASTSTVTGGSASIALSGIDSNAGGPFTFTFAIASPPMHGSVTIAGDAATYVPTAGFAGDDSFTFTATTVNGTSAPATVSVRVQSSTAVAVPVPSLSDRVLYALVLLVGIGGVVRARRLSARTGAGWRQGS